MRRITRSDLDLMRTPNVDDPRPVKYTMSKTAREKLRNASAYSGQEMSTILDALVRHSLDVVQPRTPITKPDVLPRPSRAKTKPVPIPHGTLKPKTPKPKTPKPKTPKPIARNAKKV